MDPQDVGVAERWYDAGVAFDMTVQVLGAWNAQGVGKQTDKMFHDFPGPGWYRRSVTISSAWKDKLVWLKFGGVHRRADVWVNGQKVGGHVGYLTPFKLDISAQVRDTAAASIVVRVDGRQGKDDPLIGCFDVIDAMDLTWGGLYRSVDLEATARAWVEDVFVVPHVESGSAEVRLEIGAVGSIPDGLGIGAEVSDQDGRRAGSAEQRLAAGATTVTVVVPLDHPKLWSPQQPYLYTVRIKLSEGGRELDTVSVRFGMREIKVQGGRIILNGKPIFLRGYGDDCIYPNTIAPPADKEEYYRRFRIAKDYGFNYVRHHSWFPLREYFDVADELGIMLQPEFPIAYPGNYAGADPEKRKLYIEQWTGVIKASRNHPSIVTWCMGNELNPAELDLAPEFHRIAREIDPTRLVILTDGLAMPAPTDPWARFVDFVTPGYNEGGSIGFQDNKYGAYGPQPAKPVVIHEMSNFATLPDPSQAELFHEGIRPFWLYRYRELAEKTGVSASLPKWVQNSNKLQAVCLKTNLEAARRSPAVSGYDQWLLQDYWTGSNGVLDMFYRPKGLTAAEFRKFNAPTVVLMECAQRNVRSGETVKLSILVSRFEDEPTENAALNWELRDGDRVLRSGTEPTLRIASDGVQKLTDVSVTMPGQTAARKLTFAVELRDGSGTFANDWSFWVFPQDRLRSGTRRLGIGGSEQLRALYPWAERVADRGQLARCDLLVSSNLVAGSVDYLSGGGRVLLLSADQAFPVLSTAYKPYWWLVSGPSDSTGTVIDQEHPALKEMPSDGWCDLVFYNLINGSSSIVLDGLPAKVSPIVRCLDTHAGLANRAFLVEFSVGQGKLLVSSFNFEAAAGADDPAAAFLLDGLIRYALSPQFAPTAALPADYLRLAEGRTPTPPTARRVNGFARMVSSPEKAMAYHSHRADAARCWFVRQTDGTQRMEWETSPVRLDGADQISLVWTGAMGFVSEPRGSFTIHLNGKPLVDFDVAWSSRTWTSADGRAELFFDVKQKLNQDAFGVMYLTVPADMLADGKPATLSVTGSKSASARWCMVFDFTDTIEHEK